MGKRDKVDSPGKALDQVARHLHRQTGFANPARAGDRDQAHILTQQEFPGGSDFLLPSHESGPLRRKIRRTHLSLPRRLVRETVAQGSQFPREIPIDGVPEHTTQIVKDYGDWMATNDIPKLLINGNPGTILTGSLLEFCRTWPNQEEVTVRGKHFLQEDSPHEIGQAIARWLIRLAGTRATTGPTVRRW